MNKVDIVREAFNLDNPELRASHLADDFQATDSLGGLPNSKEVWLGMGQMLRASFPDMEYVITHIHEEGDGVHVAGHFAGTFTSDLDMSPMGMGVISATGKKVMWPDSTRQVSFDGDKISRLHSPDTGPDAGVGGFLKALGAGG